MSEAFMHTGVHESFTHAVGNPGRARPVETQARPGRASVTQARSNRSRFITLVQAATKSVTNFSFASSLA
jgi:hypothetical protein